MPTDDIPITFTYANQTYTGTFSRVMGAGSSAMFHLMIGGRYYGQLFNTEKGWRFYSNQFPDWTELFSDEFGRVIVAAEG